MPTPTKLVCALTFTLTIVSGAATAAQFNYSLYAGIVHSDNINLTNTDPISQNVLIPGVNFNFMQQGATIQANAIGNIEFRKYLGNDFSSQTQTQLAGRVNWTVAPQRLDLTLEDYASVQPVDNLASNAPANQQQTNVFSIGPTLHFDLGTALHGQGELRYVNSKAQKTKGFNSSRGLAALRIIRDLNATDQLSLNAETQRTNFDHAESGPNYNRNEAFLGYVSHLAHVDIDAAFGWSKLEFDKSSARTISSPLVRAALAWRLTEQTTLTAAGSRQFSDAALGMQQAGQAPIGGDAVGGNIGGSGGGGIAGGANAGNTAVNSEVYTERRGSLSYGFRTERLLLSVTPTYRKLDYVVNPLFNQTGRGGNVGIQYQLQPSMQLSASAQSERLTYQTLIRRDESFGYDVTLSKQTTPHWGWRIAYSHQQRRSSIPTQGFHENRIYFGVAFTR